MKKIMVACILLMLTSGCMLKFTSHTGDKCLIAVLSGYVEAELDTETGDVTWNRGGWYKASGIEVKKDGQDYKVHFDASETEKISLEELKTLLLTLGII